jgi:cob(I)alamin adenosyltransferase
MKIYTGGGDRGITSLFSGERVAKSHARIEANGALDELSAFLGVVAVTLADEGQAGLVEEIQGIQSDLLQVGAWLATTPDSSSADMLQEIDPGHITALEQAIDRMDTELPGLTGFILPGGRPAAAWAHVARTICRRAERHVVGLLEQPGDGKGGAELHKASVYLNRLSDYLFMLARYCNWLAQVPDIPWKK